VFFISRYSSLSAIVASISAPLIGFFIMKDQSIYCVAYALITIIILLKHHTNIKKLISGTELKFKK
ncbi:MAG: glycerol-3-phosphate acyltransferase, partial [Nitrosomonadales bacterium]|nr:glycerol-3-phosphate acyltransferase [Nitrosomonadales bacterium]